MKKLVCILFLVVAQVAVAQKYKPGKVSKEELQETQNSLYPDANATVLYREYKTYYVYNQSKGFEIMTEVFERIKIYKPEGYKWGTKKIRTYNHGKDRENLESIKAVTYNLVEGSIEKDKLSKKNIFEERLNNYYVGSSFTMPNLKTGSVIEIEYTLSSPFTSIDDIELQYSIPIKKIVAEVRTPEFYIYKNYPNPQAALSYTYERSEKNVEVAIRGRSGVGSANYGTFADKSQNKNKTSGYKENVYFLDETNIPPLKDEGFVDNLSNYQAKSIWELSFYNSSNGNSRNYATTWDAVTKTIYENDNFVNELNKSSYYQEDLTAVLANATTPEEKMNAIFNLVKSKVVWNTYLGYFPENGVKKAYKEGNGNVADINLMLVSMLRTAGFDANPVLVSTKKNGIPVFPTRYGFDYLIAQVSNSGTSYVLDATDTFASIGLLPGRAMNWQGRIIRQNGTSNWLPLYPTFVSNKLTYIQAEIKPEETTIMVRERLGSHFAKEYRNKFYKKPEQEQLAAIDKNGEEISFTELTVKDIETTKKNMTLSYKAKSGSIVEDINGDLYFSPMLYFAQKENPFKEETRTYPLFFDFPKSKKYNITIKIPEGYAVKSLPEATKVAIPGDAIAYSYLISETNGNLQLAVAVDIKQPALVADDYGYIKALFTQIVEKENEKVVLTKI